MQEIINEYRAAFSRFRNGGLPFSGMSHADGRLKLQSLRDKIGYVVFPMGPQTIKILNLPENHERFAKNLAKAKKPLPTYAQQFEAARRAQMKTTCGPVERARIMAEHMDAGTYSEGVEDGSD